MERLRDQAAAGSFDRLYVHSPDRLSRRYAYQVLLVDELQRQGIQIVFLNHDIGQSPEENLLLQVQGVVAEYERAKILERSRRGKRHAAKEGTVNVLCGAPYGYRYIGKHEGGGQARYEVSEAQAEVVRQIFTWVAVSIDARSERCVAGCGTARFPAREARITGTGRPCGASSRILRTLAKPGSVRPASDHNVRASEASVGSRRSREVNLRCMTHR